MLTFKKTSLGKHNPSHPSAASYHHQSVKHRNGGTRETEQELYASPHTPTQSNQAAGDHHYYYIDGARTDTGAHSDSTVLYEDPTSPSYVVCVFTVTCVLCGMCFTAALYSALYGKADCCSIVL